MKMSNTLIQSTMEKNINNQTEGERPEKKQLDFSAMNNVAEWFEIKESAEMCDRIADLLGTFQYQETMNLEHEIALMRLLRNAFNRVAIANGEQPWTPSEEM